MKKHLILRYTAVLVLAVSALPLAAQSPDGVEITARYDAGFAAVLWHEFQSGSAGTRFNFVTQGGQDILFPYQRFTVEAVLGGVHRATFLYQPLTVNTRTVADRNGTNGGQPVVIDTASFAPGTPIDLTYGFDFWRASYLYDFASDEKTILGAGISLQIRNASIVFSSANGTVRTIQQNIGPVPILKARAAWWVLPVLNLDFEVDGFYASSSFFNGAARPFTGWVWDTGLTASTGFFPDTRVFLSIRSIGGGAEGNNAYDYVSSTTSSAGSYTYNNLGTLEVTLGLKLQK